MQSPQTLDGKEVRKYLFARETKIAQSGCIPLDRKERKRALDVTDQPRYLVLVEVHAFDKDHAIDRLVNELYPFVARKDWEFVEELTDPAHDLGRMGAKHPLLPIGSRPNVH